MSWIIHLELSYQTWILLSLRLFVPQDVIHYRDCVDGPVRLVYGEDIYTISKKFEGSARFWDSIHHRAILHGQQGLPGILDNPNSTYEQAPRLLDLPMARVDS